MPERELPFKEIDSGNWLTADPVVLHFPGMKDIAAYVEAVLAPRLSQNVPEEVHKLFEVARGTMLYGYLFFPLYTLSPELEREIFRSHAHPPPFAPCP